MKNVIILISCIIVIGLFSSCKSNKLQDFEYIPLAEYEHETNTIAPGTELELLAFSGGKKEEEGTVFYYQFLVLDKTTNDTLRILTPLISVDNDGASGEASKIPVIRVDNTNGIGANVTYTTPMLYDPAKRITTAYFQIKDSSQNLILQTEDLVAKAENPADIDIKKLMDTMDKKELVVVNKDMEEFSSKKYRAVVGILNFKRQPW